MIIKTLYLARDTDTVCLFENKPVIETFPDGFAFIDTKSQWFSELKDANLKKDLNIGEIIKILIEK